MSSQSSTEFIAVNPSAEQQPSLSSNLPDILRPRIRLEDFRPPTLQAPETPRPFYIDPELLQTQSSKSRLHPKSMLAGAMAGIGGVLVGVLVASLLRPLPLAVPTSEPVAVVTRAPTIVLAPTATQVPAAVVPAATNTAAPPSPTRQTAPIAEPTAAAPSGARPLSGASGPAPFFGPNYSASDSKPVYVCALASFGSYLTALQIQSSGLDVANGFHLAIVPEAINDDYEMSYDVINASMRDGRFDCYFDTLDSLARHGHGKLTAVVNESAGGDGIFARDIGSIYDLRGKRIAYETDGSSEYFLRYVLFVAQIAERDVTLLPSESIDDAVAAFAAGEADAISGYDPYFDELDKTGGRALIMSDNLRIIIDGIITSDKAIAERPQLVQSFHTAWFAALKRQAEDADAAAAEIAAFGHNDWSMVDRAAPGQSFRGLMRTIAQASLAQNAALMRDPAPLLDSLDTARTLWREVVSTTNRPMSELIAPQFTLRAAESDALRTDQPQINTTFSLALPVDAAIMPTAELPCSRFVFDANSAELTAASKRVLDLCVLPILRQRSAARMTVTGSAAWPGPAAAYSERAVHDLAFKRANTIAAYLRAHGIPKDRVIVAAALPAVLNRGSTDPLVLASDRVVRMTIELAAR